MSSSSKSVAAAHSESARVANLYRVAIVGGATLKGKEVAEVLTERSFPVVDVKLLDDDESLGQLEAVQDEITFIQSVRAEQFENLDFTFFASDPECTRRNWQAAQKAGSAIVDLSFALEAEASARVRSPWIERQLGLPLMPELQPAPAVTAHSAAVVLALLLLRAQKAGKIEQAVATVLEPASEHGQKGMDELHEQTVNLLSFQPLPKRIFDTQVAFNLVNRYGEQSVPALASVQERIFRHYRQIAGQEAPQVSLLLVQAPIFHGHSFALCLQMREAADLAGLAQALAGEHITLAQSGEEAPSNVNAAGRDDISVSIAGDATNARACWLWAAADNLRIAARNAVECAESMAATRPKGSVQ